MRAKSVPFILLVALLVGCSPSSQESETDPDAESAAEKLTEVRISLAAVERSGIVVEPVRKQVLLPTFIAPARVSFNEEAFAHVGTPVPGRTIDIRVRIGDEVAKNETLLVVESPELGAAQSDFLQKRTGVVAGEASLSPLQLAYERGMKIYEMGQGISLAEVQKREADMKAALGQLETTKSALKAAEQKLVTLGMDQKSIEELSTSGRLNSHQQVKATIAGTIVQREVTLGELVIPDKETLVVIADMTKLWIIADVPEAKLQHVKKGARVHVRVSAATKDILEGKVAIISPSLDLSTRSVPVRIEVDAKQTKLIPGMFAEAEIEFGDPQDTEPTVVIPESAVQSIAGTTVVFVIEEGEPGTFIKRTVKLGQEVDGKFQVLSGLREGEKIVTEGGFVLKAELGKGQTDDD